jgi:hypothetical protein
MRTLLLEKRYGGCRSPRPESWYPYVFTSIDDPRLDAILPQTRPLWQAGTYARVATNPEDKSWRTLLREFVGIPSQISRIPVATHSVKDGVNYFDKT